MSEPPRRLPAAEAVRHARAALDGGEPVVGATVIESSVDSPAAGERMAVWADRHAGTLGSAETDAEAVRLARALLAEGGRAGTREVATDAGRIVVYLEPHAPPPELVIVGAGHIARPLCRTGAMLGFRVTVLDDRPEFATRERFPEAAEVRRADFAEPFCGVALGPRSYLVLVTRGHKYDFEALRQVLRMDASPAYVGMVGSRRRTRAAMEMLVRDGIPPERLAAVRAPIGLDVGAETPEEIAVSIAAEIVQARRGGTGAPLSQKERVLERWIRPRAPGPEPEEEDEWSD